MNLKIPGSEAEGVPVLTRILGYWHIVYRWKWVVMLTAGGVLTAAYFWTDKQTRIYEARTSVEINTVTPQVITNVREVVELGTGSYWASKEFFTTQYQIIRSRAVAERVVKAEGLARDLDYLGLKSLEGTPQLEGALKRIDPIAITASRTRVEPVRESRLVWVVFEDSDPARAQRLSVAIAEAYLQYNMSRKTGATQDALAKLLGDIPGLERQLTEAEKRLSEFRAKNMFRVTSFEENLKLQGEKLQTAWKKYQDYLWSRNALEKELAELGKLNGAGAAGEYSSLVLQNGLIQRLKGEIADIERRYRKLLERYHEGYQDVRDVKRELETARTSLDEEVRKLERNRKATARERDAFLRSLGRLEREARESFQREDALARQLTAQESEHNRLVREVRYSEAALSRVLQRIKEIELTKDETQTSNNVTVLDRARLPSRPVRPRFAVNLMVAGLLGLFLGLVFAMFLDNLDNTVRTQDTVEAVTGFTFLGMIPLVRDIKRTRKIPARLSEQEPQSFVSEATRGIRTNLLFMSPDKTLSTLLVTSSGPEDGKTTVACNLATSTALTGKRVLLVDTDMRRPNIHRVFGLGNEKGLSSLILMDTSVEDVVAHTGVANLWLLPCGPVPPNPSELLQSERFRRVFQMLTEKFDHVVFDSPPSLVVADALLLGKMCDGTLLVVNGGRTTKDALGRTARQFAALKVNVLGCVLNSVDLDDRKYGYYYQYHYQRRYGYYYRSSGEEAKPREGSAPPPPASPGASA